MRKSDHCFVWLFILVLCACDIPKNKYQDHERISAFELSKLTASGLFHVKLTTEDKSSLPIGKYHNWVILVTDPLSNPINPAVIRIAGGMPAHGHGLPTKPIVTDYLGGGQYRLEGVKFNMDGSWKIVVHIMTEQAQDIAEFNFDVSY